MIRLDYCDGSGGNRYPCERAEKLILDLPIFNINELDSLREGDTAMRDYTPSPRATEKVLDPPDNNSFFH